MSAFTHPAMEILLRRREPEDEGFLFGLFAESQFQLSQIMPNEALWRSLVEIQYKGRELTYARAYPAAEDMILCLKSPDEIVAVGRLLVDRKPDHWRIVDMAISAPHRSQGLGTSVLRQYMAECSQGPGRLGLQVASGNPARHLYERLGFRPIAEDAAGIEMSWTARGE